MKRSIVYLLHFGYWLMYVVLLATILALLSVGIPHILSHNWRVIYFLVSFALVPAIASFYTFYGFIFPQFLGRKKTTYFILSVLLVPFLCAFLGWVLLYITWGIMAPNGGPSLTQGGTGVFLELLMIMALNAFANGVIALVMHGFITWYGDITVKEELAKKNYEMELNLVKSQINPHFLFNTLNNIDELIETSAETASAYLHKLSDIMRFMLYETKTERVLLTHEISYIEKYIDLQRIRVSNPAYVQFQLSGNPAAYTVAPMIFIPFVENAFKHAVNRKTGNVISIKVTVNERSVVFICENEYIEYAGKDDKQGGLGNNLIRKRIELLYPGTHTLNISDANNTYHVKLVLYYDIH